MATDLKDEQSVEMPQDYIIPNDVHQVAAWMNQGFAFIPQCNFNMLPPPPPPKQPEVFTDTPGHEDIPPPPDVPEADDVLGHLEMDMQSLEQKARNLSASLIAGTKDCDKAPLDKGMWEKMLATHKVSIGAQLVQVKKMRSNIAEEIKKSIGLPGMGQHKEDLRNIRDRLKDIEFDFLVEQYKYAKAQGEARIQNAENACGVFAERLRDLDKRMVEFESQARQGMDVEHWDPNRNGNYINQLFAEYTALRNSLPSPLTVDTSNALSDLDETSKQVRESLLEEIAKQVDFKPQAKALQDEFGKVSTEADGDKFPIDDWNPLANGKKWLNLKARTGAFVNQIRGVPLSDGDQEVIDAMMETYEELHQYLCAKGAERKGKVQAELALAPRLFAANAEAQALSVELVRINNLALTLGEELQLIAKGLNCETNADRAAMWKAVNKDALPLPGFDWDKASQRYQALKKELEQLNAALPWEPDKLQLALAMFRDTFEKHEDAKAAVDHAKAIFDEYNFTVGNPQTDIDLKQMASIKQRANDLWGRFYVIAQPATDLVSGDAEEIKNMQSSEQREAALNNLNKDWMANPGTPWSNAIEELKDLGDELEVARTAIDWDSPLVLAAQAEIDSTKDEAERQGKFVEQAMKLYDELLKLDDELDEIEGVMNDPEVLDDKVTDQGLYDDGADDENAATPGGGEEEEFIEVSDDLHALILDVQSDLETVNKIVQNH